MAAGAAGGHYDPQHTGKHEGPLGAGHLGDLPLLVVNDAGVADQPIIAPRLKNAGGGERESADGPRRRG